MGREIGSPLEKAVPQVTEAVLEDVVYCGRNKETLFFECSSSTVMCTHGTHVCPLQSSVHTPILADLNLFEDNNHDL